MLTYNIEATTLSPVTPTTSNKSINSNDAYAQPPSPENLQILFGFYILLLISTIITNGPFIGLMILRRKKWTAHDILILNISISDVYYVISL